MDIDELEWMDDEDDEPRLATPGVDEIVELVGIDQSLNDSARTAVLKAMRKAAEHEAEVLVDDARTHAEELVVRRQKMAEDKIGAAERAAIAAIRAKAVNAATSAAATLIAQGHDAPSDKALVDSAIGKLGTIN